MIDPLTRLEDIDSLIETEGWFTIHAPRQTGKTTYLYALARKLNAEGHYVALVVSFERAGYRSIPIEKANEVLIHSIFQAASVHLDEEFRPLDPSQKDFLDLKDYLFSWSRSQKKPLVLLIDEIDALFDDVLISILRQLRDGYQLRPASFPSSIALVGLRDVREYKATLRPDNSSLGTASPFNIKSESLFLTNFTSNEVAELLQQHTIETGQVFPAEVKEEIFNLTAGQPWLVNALAHHIVTRILKQDHALKIKPEHAWQAKRDLILRRDTHLDSLMDKLKEERVKRIVQAIINGSNIVFDILDDDIVYVRDLGIVAQSDPLKFANPIYAEIIPRIMASPIQSSIPEEIQPPAFITPEGKFDMDLVLKEFQNFYRRNSEAWLDRFTFKESAHHLLLMAFLQRVINAGGDIVWEMAVGNGRIDLLVKYKKQEFALELKIKRDKHTISDGLEQLTRYLTRLNLSQGYLIVFDPTPRDWDEKIQFQTFTHKTKTITLVNL
jgi:hypothetical protein